MKRIGQALSALLIAAVIVTAASPSLGYIYAGRRKKINCGVILLNNGVNQGVNDCNNIPFRAGGKPDLVYSLFTLLQNRLDLKPAGWSLENPLSAGSPPGGLGDFKPEDHPDYWLVNLHSHSSLAKMHVLYLPASGKVTLDDEDREKLRQFVDSGGVLWIDNMGTGVSALDFQGTFFIPNFKFQSTGGGFDIPVSRHHPALTLPFWLSDGEIASLGQNPGQYDCIPGYDPGSVGGWSSVSKLPFTLDTLYPVVDNSTTRKPSVAANAFGSGRIIATANAVGRGCFLNYPSNLPSLKFAYNVIAWSASWTHFRKDPRHSGSSIDTVGGTKLIKSWTFETGQSSKIEAAPVIYKNIVFYTSGSQLYALDLAPDEDLDQDGNPDDGFQGYVPGGADLVWAWQTDDASKLSTPTIVTAQDPADPSKSFEAVLVMSDKGVVYALPAFPNQGGILVQNPSMVAPIPGWGTWDTGGGPMSEPYPPLYVNGWIYAVGGTGILYAFNPSIKKWGEDTGQATASEWKVPNQPGVSCTPKAGPSFGWVRNETNGALVGMVYWAGTTWSTMTTYKNDWIYGAPVFVSSDRLKWEKSNPSGTLVQCKIAIPRVAIAKSPEPVVWVMSDSGPIQNVTVHVNRTLNATLDAILPADAPGFVVLESAGIPTGSRIVMAYAIDYGGVLAWGQAPIQRWLEPASTTGTGSPPPTKLNGTPAMGADSMIFACGTRDNDPISDSVYGMKNDGATHSCKWNYQLHEGYDPSGFTGGHGPVLPPVIFDDQGRVMKSPKAYGSPAVSGNKVFVAISGTPNPASPETPSAAIACFKANPDFVIRITESAGYGAGGAAVRRNKRLRDSTGREMSIRLWQPNLIPGSETTPPPPMGAVMVTRNLNMVDYDRGTITFEKFDSPKLKGMMGVVESNTFTPSLPVSVWLDNVEVPVDYTTWAPAVRWGKITGNPPNQPLGDAVDLSAWNNLLWYFIVPPHGGTTPCSGIHSSPVVIGGSVYFVCDDGVLMSIPTDTDESQGGQVKNALIWDEDLGSAMVDAKTSPAGSNGVLVVPGSQALHAFANSTTLVAEGGRVIEVDGSGEATWSVDMISWPATAPPDAKTYPPRMSGPVNKPAKAKYAGPGEVLVVNTGANQVCKIDKSGTVGFEVIPNTAISFRYMWNKFRDPKRLLRPGQPTELLAPTDAVYWREWEGGNLVIHCLIADSGNHRILDLVYRISYSNNQPTGMVFTGGNPGPDPASGFYLPELNWVSVTDSMNEQYVYECLTGPIGQSDPNAGQDIWAAVSNYRTGTDWDQMGAASNTGLGGAIVALKYRVRSGQTWNYAPAKSGQVIAACDRADWGGSGGLRPLAQPKYFEVKDRAGSLPNSVQRFIIVCDNYGVYEIGPLPAGTAAPPVRRAFTDEDYRNMDRDVVKECDNATLRIPDLGGVPLQARCVQELRNGNWLITNNYAGSNTDGTKRFSGEVFELSWSTANPATIDRISWNAPELLCRCVMDPDGTQVPAPDTWRQNSKTSYVFRQPNSAFRQF